MNNNLDHSIPEVSPSWGVVSARDRFRRTLVKLAIVLCSQFLFAFPQIVKAQLSEIKNEFPKNVPVKVEFKNYDKPNWWNHLEIKVTNIGKKPIFYLSMTLITDRVTPEGKQIGFPLRFGDITRLYSTERLANEADPSIPPKGSYTFVISRSDSRAWDFAKTKVNFVEPTTAVLRHQFLNFGDGTGLEPGGTPFKKKAPEYR
jgi:hypothetical protein